MSDPPMCDASTPQPVPAASEERLLAAGHYPGCFHFPYVVGYDPARHHPWQELKVTLT